ncbi:hypothetical protein PCI56_25970 [Plesiomonas shigelloides subsp. oncorhynchi]|nr:hypothetical protein [Plesiomonas shigelloides]
MQSFQNKKMELQYGLKTLIDNGDNEVIKLTSGSFFNSLREMDQTTSDALASQDPTAIEKAMKANKINIGRLGYAFKGLVAQVPMLGERYGEMFEAFLTDAGRKMASCSSTTISSCKSSKSIKTSLRCLPP